MERHEGFVSNHMVPCMEAHLIPRLVSSDSFYLELENDDEIFTSLSQLM